MRVPKVWLFLAALTTGLATTTLPDQAEAFCGFYVAGADAKLYNNATMVVLMRDGTRTVLSMQNNYQGPPEDFAMVVPVPVVLQKDDVKVLPPAVFDRVDKLTAPRLVEYWEIDPCWVQPEYQAENLEFADPLSPEGAHIERERNHGVTVEAKFEVGEYDVVILSATESNGLDNWLRREKYNIPRGAERLLRPYVESGSKFFVAKVDSKKVQFDADGQAMLSPLRFHYDSQEFALPVRLGLINAKGPQDLLVHILARGVRYETANYPNVTIPTNLEVEDEVRDRFGQFYASLFDHTLANNPNAVVTEYSWAAGSCDPCPEQPLTLDELELLGVIRYEGTDPSDFVLTRLHARYNKDSLGEDLIFQAAPAIVGGREWWLKDGQPEYGAVVEPNGDNSFQARYIIRHPWDGPIECENPKRGRWGGPGPTQPSVARNLAFLERGAVLRDLVTESAAERIEQEVGPLPNGPIEAPLSDSQRGCAHCSTIDAGWQARMAGFSIVAMIGLFGFLGVRRRRRA